MLIKRQCVVNKTLYPVDRLAMYVPRRFEFVASKAVELLYLSAFSLLLLYKFIAGSVDREEVNDR